MEIDLFENVLKLSYLTLLQDNVYEYRQIPFKKRCKAWFRLMDFYANPITLRYKGEK